MRARAITPSPRLSEARQRTRKLIGAFALVGLVVGWPLIVAALAEGRLANLTTLAQVAAFVGLGLVWVIPAGLLIRWMQRPDPGGK